MFVHGMALGGWTAQPQCSVCHGRSYLTRSEWNTNCALALLLAAFMASYPSPISDSYLAGLSHPWPAIVRVGIWAFAVLAAFAVFTFAGRMTPLAPEAKPRSLLTWPSLIAEWAFLGSMVWWMYVMYSGLK
jgi:hypothetical protein